MSLMLKTRKGNTVPFGYKLAEDNHSLEPIEKELAALEKAKELKMYCPSSDIVVSAKLNSVREKNAIIPTNKLDRYFFIKPPYA